jgi:hypothetical protein
MEASDYWLNVPDAVSRSGWCIEWTRLLIRKNPVVALKRVGQYLVNAQSLRKHMQRKNMGTLTILSIFTPKNASQCYSGV